MEQALPRRKRNWWIPAFFIALIAFELAREVAVVASAQGAVPSGSAFVFGGDGYATARGRWERTDGGEDLVPTLVTIECWRDSGKCIEAWIHVDRQYVSPPEVDSFDANFTSDSVTYENTSPTCVTYAVRIDLRIRRVIAVRERRPNANGPTCTSAEPRIEMQIGDAFRPNKNAHEGHFVPFLSVLVAVL